MQSLRILAGCELCVAVGRPGGIAVALVRAMDYT